MARSNLKIKAPPVFTHEGARAVRSSAGKELRRSLMSCMLFEDNFYEDGVAHADRMKDLIKRCTFDEAAEAAIDAREKFKLRHAPLLVVRELIRNHGGRKVGDLITRVIQRPDEMGELLALYWKDQPNAPLSAQLKIGLARAMKKFNEYELAKWDKPGDVSLRDVLFLSHSRPRGAEDRFTKKERKGRTKFDLNEHEKLYKRIVDGELKTPDTWETQLSAGADKKETFTRLIGEGKLGALALLRNLRGMKEAGVSDDVIRGALRDMKTERVLPFRFITAAKYAPYLEDALEAAMFKCLAHQPKLAGKTALLVDVSGSMVGTKVSAKSEIDRRDAACGLSMLLREVCEQVRVFAFTTATYDVAPRRGFALAELIKKVPSGGTDLRQAVKRVAEQYPDYDRLIVITDEQSATRPQTPNSKGYIINVGTSQNGIAYGPWISIDGWSEATLDFIREYEAE